MKLINTNLLGVLSFLPFIFYVFFVVFSFTNFGREILNQITPNPNPILMTLFILTMIITITIIAYYIVFLFRSDIVKGDKKALWAVVILWANIIGLPFFWYFCIYKNSKSTDELEENI